MPRTIVTWVIRFAMFAGAYVAAAAVWVNNAKGWHTLAVLGAALRPGPVE